MGTAQGGGVRVSVQAAPQIYKSCCWVGRGLALIASPAALPASCWHPRLWMLLAPGGFPPHSSCRAHTLLRCCATLQDGSITKKNSPARNLHRLMTSLSFISHIFQNLSAGQQLREAVSGAAVRAGRGEGCWVGCPSQPAPPAG